MICEWVCSASSTTKTEIDPSFAWKIFDLTERGKSFQSFSYFLPPINCVLRIKENLLSPKIFPNNLSQIFITYLSFLKVLVAAVNGIALGFGTALLSFM